MKGVCTAPSTTCRLVRCTDAPAQLQPNHAGSHVCCMDLPTPLSLEMCTFCLSTCSLLPCLGHRHLPVCSVVQPEIHLTWTDHCCSNMLLQVAPRPVLTNVALQVPLLAADASLAQLEADLLKGNLQLNHCRLHLAELVSFHICRHVTACNTVVLVASCGATCSY